MISRYLDKFNRLATEGKEAYVLTGDALLVEQIKEPERKTASGLVMATNINQRNSLAEGRPHLCIVLTVGAGYYDDKDPSTTIPLDVQPGDIILVGPLSVKYFSFFGDLQPYEPDSIGITRESEIQLRFRGKEGYDQAFAILNRKSETTVENTIL